MFRLLAILVFVCAIGSALCGSTMAENAAPKSGTPKSGAPKSGAPKNAAPDVSPRAFTEKVAAGLAAKLPNYKFTVTGEFDISRRDPDGSEADLRTRNFYDDYKRD